MLLNTVTMRGSNTPKAHKIIKSTSIPHYLVYVILTKSVHTVYCTTTEIRVERVHKTQCYKTMSKEITFIKSLLIVDLLMWTVLESSIANHDILQNSFKVIYSMYVHPKFYSLCTIPKYLKSFEIKINKISRDDRWA